MELSQLSVTNVITALGALGTASFGLVDTTKAVAGGISRVGIGDIEKALLPLFGAKADPNDKTDPFGFASVLDNLRANWMNGVPLADQKAIAKTHIKLRLSPDTAHELAVVTGIDANLLATIADKVNNAVTLLPAEADAFGRFDLALTSRFDQAYQRADQRYRNTSKIMAGIFSIAIAWYSGYIFSLHTGRYGVTLYDYVRNSFSWGALLAGALATPIAPIAKDLTSALSAGTNLIQRLGKP